MDAAQTDAILLLHWNSGCKTHLFNQGDSKKITCVTCNSTDIPEVMTSCSGCEKVHCLQHRGSHNCSAPSRMEEEKIQKKEEIKQFVHDKLKRSTTSQSSGPTKKKALSPQVELMLLKSTAKGDSIPEDAKVYFRLWMDKKEFAAGQMPLYLHKDWTVGKAIDWIAQRAKLNNVNNSGDVSRRLNLYASSGKQLSTSNTMKSLLETGDLTNGGGLLLLRGQGDEVDASMCQG
jgi:hypothetical protein